MKPAQYQYFTKSLLHWHASQNERSLPWKEEQDPYRIWLSEILLQQTQATQALPYYKRFIRIYPNVQALAADDDEAVFKLWEGLGYYSRCRNLLTTARHISSHCGGQFPDTYEGLLALKGVGPYTAAAIASFAFDLPYPVLDGNVQRIISRYFGISEAVDSTDGRNRVMDSLSSVFPKKQAAQFNQAIMDFGATVCKPKPRCTDCPLNSRCIAFSRQLVALLPVKQKRTKVSERHFHYLVLVEGDEVYMQKREKKDIWQGLYEFFLMEGPAEKFQKIFFDPSQIKNEQHNVFSTQQRLSHQLIKSQFSIIHLKSKPTALDTLGLWISKESLKKLPFPRTITRFLEEMPYF